MRGAPCREHSGPRPPASAWAGVGAAVGLWEGWRFSTVVGQDGGDAFVSLLRGAVALGGPLMVLEMSGGRAFRAAVVTALRRVRSSDAVLGWVVPGTLLLVVSDSPVVAIQVRSFALLTAVGSDVSFAAFAGTDEPWSRSWPAPS